MEENKSKNCINSKWFDTKISDVTDCGWEVGRPVTHTFNTHVTH